MPMGSSKAQRANIEFFLPRGFGLNESHLTRELDYRTLGTMYEVLVGCDAVFRVFGYCRLYTMRKERCFFLMRKERGSQITYGGYWNVAGTLGPAIG